MPGIAADALVGVLLHGAQELRLQGQRQLADLVEEQGAAVRQREGAVARAHGAGERATFVTEQFAAGELRNDGRAVDDHEFPLCRGAGRGHG